jgi:surface protein
LEVTPVWSTLNPAVATVDSTGLVTGVSSGSASIVGAYDGMGAQTIVTVFEPFFLAENGVTVVCTDAQVGDTGVVNGVTYTKRDRAGLDALLVEAESSGDYSGFSTTCTTGVTSLFSLLYTGVVPGPHDAFNEDISSWDVSSVTDMGNMAQGVSSFNADLRAWDLGLVSNLDGMLNGTAFNQDVSGWDISSARFMRELFSATPFNQDISGWDVSQVEAMGFMFAENSVFAQDLSGWDVSSVTDFDTMFRNASSFNADLSGWCVTSSDGVLREFDANTPSWTLPKPVWGTCSPASVLQSTLTANTTAIPAGGFSTVTLTVQLKDAAGVDLTDNTRTLTFDTPSQGSISAVTVNNDGTYTATYTSGSDIGTVTIVARLDGIAMTQTVVISLET